MPLFGVSAGVYRVALCLAQSSFKEPFFHKDCSAVWLCTVAQIVSCQLVISTSVMKTAKFHYNVRLMQPLILLSLDEIQRTFLHPVYLRCILALCLYASLKLYVPCGLYLTAFLMKTWTNFSPVRPLFIFTLSGWYNLIVSIDLAFGFSFILS